MARYLHKPGHPYADEHGMVEAQDYYTHQYMTTEDKRAVIGNQVIELQFISDTMEPTRHMVNGKFYTSKKKFRNETKAHGCIEVGNDYQKKASSRLPKPLDKRQRRDDIKRSIWELRNGRNIVEEVNKITRPKGL